MSEGIGSIGGQVLNCLGQVKTKVHQDVIRPIVDELSKKPTDENLCYKKVFGCPHSHWSPGTNRVAVGYLCSLGALAGEALCPDPSCHCCYVKVG